MKQAVPWVLVGALAALSAFFWWRGQGLEAPGPLREALKNAENTAKTEAALRMEAEKQAETARSAALAAEARVEAGLAKINALEAAKRVSAARPERGAVELAGWFAARYTSFAAPEPLPSGLALGLPLSNQVLRDLEAGALAEAQVVEFGKMAMDFKAYSEARAVELAACETQRGSLERELATFKRLAGTAVSDARAQRRKRWLERAAWTAAASGAFYLAVKN